MKNLILAVMFAASPAAAYQEFDFGTPVVSDILAKTRALQASSSAFHKAVTEEAGHRDRRTKLLNAIEEMKEKIQKYGDDPTRAGIYNAKLGLLQFELALENVYGTK